MYVATCSLCSLYSRPCICVRETEKSHTYKCAFRVMHIHDKECKAKTYTQSTQIEKTDRPGYMLIVYTTRLIIQNCVRFAVSPSSTLLLCCLGPKPSPQHFFKTCKRGSWNGGKLLCVCVFTQDPSTLDFDLALDEAMFEHKLSLSSPHKLHTLSDSSDRAALLARESIFQGRKKKAIRQEHVSHNAY